MKKALITIGWTVAALAACVLFIALMIVSLKAIDRHAIKSAEANRIKTEKLAKRAEAEQRRAKRIEEAHLAVDAPPSLERPPSAATGGHMRTKSHSTILYLGEPDPGCTRFII